MSSSPKYKDDASLDREQRAAVEANDPAIAVLAGPGSGKTRTLSFRARHLLAKDQDSSALLLTFTNKAAAEMKSRALNVAGVSSRRIAASTFHTFCSEVLRAHGDIAGISRDFEVLDSRQQREFAQGLAAANSLPRSVVQRYRDARVRRIGMDAEQRRFAALYRDAKKELAVVDFDDLVVLVADLFNARADIAEAYGTKFPHILVDEFQDTNAVQAELIHALRRQVATVSIFADDDQAIFGFAGAESANIKRFVDAASAKVYPLTVNYRSADSIVKAANSIAVGSRSFSGRTMRADRVGGVVECRTYQNAEHEARDLSAEIAGLISHGMPTSDIAVLVRSGWRADFVVQELHHRGIPVSDWRGEIHTPEERQILALCLATVRGSLNSRQVDGLCRLMNVESPGAMTTEGFLQKFSGVPLAVGLSKMRDMLFAGASALELTQAVQTALTSQSEELGASLDEVVTSVAHFALYDKDFSIEYLLSELALGSLGRAPTEGGGVKVASLHRTKGLQWKTVYLIGLEEGHHPDYRMTDDTQFGEERRLAFVGVSRAENCLVVTWAKITGGRGRQPSRFLSEIGVPCVELR
jgi:DNA helicase II / ATP-dependent DNA helicase PcrA